MTSRCSEGLLQCTKVRPDVMIEVKVSYTKFLYRHRETLFLSSHGLTFVCVCVLSQDVRDLADP